MLRKHLNKNHSRTIPATIDSSYNSSSFQEKFLIKNSYSFQSFVSYNSSSFQEKIVNSVAASPLYKGWYKIQQKTPTPYSLQFFRVTTCAILEFPNPRVYNPRVSGQKIVNSRRPTVFRQNRWKIKKYSPATPPV